MFVLNSLAYGFVLFYHGETIFCVFSFFLVKKIVFKILLTNKSDFIRKEETTTKETSKKTSDVTLFTFTLEFKTNVTEYFLRKENTCALNCECDC